MIKFLQDTYELFYGQEKKLFLALVAVPLLAVTTTASTSIVMGLAVSLIILTSMIFYRAIIKFIPWELHLLTQLIITTLVVIVLDIYLQNAFPGIRAEMGIYLPLMALLGLSLEGLTEDPSNSFMKNWVKVLVCGLGFTLVMFLIGSFREIFGYGTFFGTTIFEQGSTPQFIIAAAPGGFFILGLLLAGYRWVLSLSVSETTAKEEGVEC